MTFRTRLVLTATAAVLVVVVLGSLATYIVADNALVGSVDVTLSEEAHASISAQLIENGCLTDHVGGVLPGGAVARTKSTAATSRCSPSPALSAG